MTLKFIKITSTIYEQKWWIHSVAVSWTRALASLAGGASAIAKTVIDKRARDRELDEQQRHNMAMESSGAGLRCDACKGTGFVGSGVFLNPNAEGSGLYLSARRINAPPF